MLTCEMHYTTTDLFYCTISFVYFEGDEGRGPGGGGKLFTIKDSTDLFFFPTFKFSTVILIKFVISALEPD